MVAGAGVRLQLESRHPLKNSVALATLPAAGLPDAGSLVGRTPDGQAHPAQITRLANGEALVGVYVGEHDGSPLGLTLEASEDGQSGRGIEVDEQPENERLVVRYSGLLQTIYHYGSQQFKPRFYPVAAPCGRPGGFDDPETVYPKSITDDSPPDHIWHRSLWYACGDVNGVDFYLENGGEGRIVHREFHDVYSGPLFGGFLERLDWVTPDGRELVRDERSFTHYRLKGNVRLFDIEAAFTAADEPVTFGQTNENALPLIRVADVIDEWDGGRLTLSDGTTGGKDAFGKRAAWADCSGPLVQRGGPLVQRGEPQWYGVAMLDHPANRNHPNAWFARSYGPLGTNLPFFDGPLTLQPGETWRLRHRIVVHEGEPWQAGIPQRFDEYAEPPSLTVAG